MIPISLIILIYFKLVRYVREMSKNITTANSLARAQRELKMVRRIVILVVSVVYIWFTIYNAYIHIFFYNSTKISFSNCASIC